MANWNVFIAPCSSERVNNLVLLLDSVKPTMKLRSIEGIISIDAIKDVLNQEENEALKKIYHDGKVRLWGTRFRNIWISMNINDYVLFYQRNHFIYLAKITFKTVNSALAEKVWGKHETGETWENIFFVSNVRELNLHRKSFNKIAGYMKTFVPQGFMRIRNDASQKILERILQ